MSAIVTFVDTDERRLSTFDDDIAFPRVTSVTKNDDVTMMLMTKHEHRQQTDHLVIDSVLQGVLPHLGPVLLNLTDFLFYGKGEKLRSNL